MASYDESDGVWRTVGGRRIFIREGQSLGDAMKASGKFKKASKVKRSEYQTEQAKLEKEKADQRLKDLTEEHPEAEDTKGLEGKHIKKEETEATWVDKNIDKLKKDYKKETGKEPFENGKATHEFAQYNSAQYETQKYIAEREYEKQESAKKTGNREITENGVKRQATDEEEATFRKIEETFKQDQAEGKVGERLKSIQDQERYDRQYDKYKEQGYSEKEIADKLGERPKTGLEKESGKTYAPEDLEQGKPYEIDMGNGIKKTAIYMGKDEEGNSSFYDGEGVGGTFGFSDKFMKENIKISDNKDDDKFMELHNQIKKETAPGKETSEKPKTYQEYYGLKDNRNEMTVKEYEDGNIDQQELKDMLRRGGESEDTIHKIVKANTGANSKDERIRNLFNDTEKEKAEYAREKAEEYKNTKDPMFQDVKEERAKGYEKQAKEAESRINQSSRENGLNSKADYEHDLRTLEDLEKKYPTKGGLKNNEDYQTLKAQYESEFKTKWNSGSEAKETPKYRWKDIDGKTIEPGDYKRVGGGSLVKQNEDGTSVHIATTRKGDGSLEYTRYDYDANGDTGKGKTYKSLEEAKAGKTGNEAMNDTLRRKAYNKYMKEHPNSKKTFEDFMKK